MAGVTTAPVGVTAQRPTWRRPGAYLFLAKVLFLVALCVGVAALLFSLQEHLRLLGRWGYLGGFLVALIDTADFFVPTPAPAVIFSLGRELNPWLLGLVSGLGASLGAIVGFLAGKSTQKAFRQSRAYARVQGLTHRWGGPMVLAVALVPFPIDLAGMWAGAMRYSLVRFLVWVTPAKIIKVSSYSLAGAYGSTWIFELFGLS